jgi:hypothetical protein
MNLKSLVKTPLFFLILHVVLIVYTVFISGYLLNLKQVSREIAQLKLQTQDASELKEVLNTQGNYLQSQTYKIKFIKDTLGRKIIGEKVIDTTSWEQNVTTNLNYIPNEFYQSDKGDWIQCFTGKQLSCFSSN